MTGFATWSIKPPMTCRKGSTTASIIASHSRFKLKKLHSPYGLSCYNGDQKRGNLELDIDPETLALIGGVEQWVQAYVQKNAQLFSDTSLKNFRSALKESTSGMRFKTKVHLEAPSAVRNWRLYCPR